MATNATPNTENATDVLILTGTAIQAFLKSLFVSSNVSGGGTSLAGALINLKRGGTAGSGGSALASVGKANPNQPTMVTGITTGATGGGTLVQCRSVGCAAPGGSGGWMAGEHDDGIKLLAGGGANGNLETSTYCGLASITLNYALSLMET